MDSAMDSADLNELAEAQEKHRRQMEANRGKVERRKARTHRLIVIGATVAKYWPGLTDLTDDEIRLKVSEACREGRLPE